MKLWLDLFHENILPSDYQYGTLEKQLSSFVEQHQEQIHALPALENISKEDIQRVGNNGIQRCVDEIFDIAKEKLECLEARMLHDAEAFCVFVSDRERAVTYAPSVPFLAQLQMSDVLKWLGEEPSNHWNLLRFLEFRYRKNFANDWLHPSDYERLGMSRSLCKKIFSRSRHIAA